PVTSTRCPYTTLFRSWRDLGEETGEELLAEVGCLLISREDDSVARPGRTGFIQRTLEAARLFGIEHSLFDTDDIRRHFPQLSRQDRKSTRLNSSHQII